MRSGSQVRVIVDYNSPSFRDNIAKLDRSKSYLVYCRTGNRTNGAVKVMRELGFPNVYVFPGGNRRSGKRRDSPSLGRLLAPV